MKLGYSFYLDINKKTEEIIHPEKVIVFLDKNFKKYKETLGYYSIITSEIEEDKEVINRYHGLRRFFYNSKNSFRRKNDICMGRITYKAHFLICFIALTIINNAI